MRRCHQSIGFDIVVRMAKVVWHKANDCHEHCHNDAQGEEILHHKIGPEWHCIFCSFGFRTTAHFNPGWIVVACGVERPNMHDHQTCDQKRQEVVQAEEAVQCWLADGAGAQKPSLQRLTNEGDRTKQACNHSCSMEGHLSPRQNIAQKASGHHEQIDQHTDDPCDFARGFVAAVVETTEHMRIDSNKEQRRAIHVEIANHMATVHVAHDVLNRSEGQIDMRCVMHHQDNTRDNLHCQAEG